MTETPTTKRRRIEMEAEGDAPAVRVFVYWGYAGWSRCQLMGEIARGSWGLCKANTQDVVSKRPDEVWQAVYPRLVFAPKSAARRPLGEWQRGCAEEMTESYGGAQRLVWALGTPGESPQEERRQQLRRMAIIHDLVMGRASPRVGPLVLRLGARALQAEEEEEIEAETEEESKG